MARFNMVVWQYGIGLLHTLMALTVGVFEYLAYDGAFSYSETDADASSEVMTAVKAEM